MISVIIPVYNTSKYVGYTIESILNQTFSDFELILVNDGSTDDSYEICCGYKSDSRVRVYSKENGGMSSARDYGYHKAKKDNWILFFDSDDIAAPDMLEKLWNYHECDMVVTCFDDCNNSVIDSAMFNIDDARVFEGKGIDILGIIVQEDKTVGRTGSLCASLMKPSFFENMYKETEKAKDSFPQNYLNDVYCTHRFLINADKAAFYNNNVFHHRLSQNSDSIQLKPNSLAYELLPIQIENIDMYKSSLPQEKYSYMLIGYYLVILKLWYQVLKYETDIQKKEKYLPLIEEAYRKKWNEIRRVKCESISFILKKMTIVLFKVNKLLWILLVGNVRYGLGYRLK